MAAALAVAVAAAAGCVAGCGPVVATRGNLVEPYRIAEIVPGQTTTDDLIQLVGTPSATSTFDDRVWYYIGQRTEQMAFFRPDIVERRVVRVQLDENGVVRDVRELSLDDAQEVELVGRETPTLGRQMTFLEQMMGNLGRFAGRGGPSGRVGPGSD